MSINLFPGKLELLLEDRLLEGQTPALLLVDMQTDLDPYPSDLTSYAPKKVRRIGKLLTFAREAEMPIIVTEFSYGRGKHLGRTLSQYQDILSGYKRSFLFSKNSHSAFFGTSLQAFLQVLGTDFLALAGFHSDDCVLSTAKDARVLGFELLTAPTVLIGAYKDNSNIEDINPFYVKECQVCPEKV